LSKGGGGNARTLRDGKVTARDTSIQFKINGSRKMIIDPGRDRLQPQISITSNNKAAAHKTEKAAKSLNWPRMTMIRRTVHSANRNSSKRRDKIDSNGLQVRLSYCEKKNGWLNVSL